ncbi:MAG TPA: xanthine dehydrogenase accessory protein XdhC [Anaeromyxobacteraceae bacterium]|nr:xanthine dehydrogenase accessory protein XdhC [Anaeromyxobacteraceae bacterium]
MDLLSRALELRERGLRFATVTVVGCEGSSPRHLGAKMIAAEDGSLYGTIGGGRLEERALERARAAIASGRPERLDLALGPGLGQCCGGRVELLVEPDVAPDRLYLFGAGHVAAALCRAAAAVDFEVTVVDEREEWNTAERFPAADRILEAGDEAIPRLAFDARATYCAVMTHRHDLDETLVRLLLGRPLRYLGLIGSRTKWARFRQRLSQRGVAPDALARVHCPIGVELRAETPAEIAVSVAAELVRVRRGALSLAAEEAPAERDPALHREGA